MATIAAAQRRTVLIVTEVDTFERIVLRPPAGFSDEDFLDFCQRPEHELLRIERHANGDIIVLAPIVFEGSFNESRVFIELSNWADLDGRGIALGPNSGLKLPDGGTRSPDACWIPNELWRALPRRERKKFPPLVPPFVIEVRSPSDRKKDLYENMLMYMRNGVELSWLIDPISRTVRIYKQSEEFIELKDPAQVKGEGPVAGFVLDLKRIYDQLDA